MLAAVFGLAHAAGKVKDSSGNFGKNAPKIVSSVLSFISFVFLVALWAWYVFDIAKIGQERDLGIDDTDLFGGINMKMETGAGLACIIAASAHSIESLKVAAREAEARWHELAQSPHAHASFRALRSQAFELVGSIVPLFIPNQQEKAGAQLQGVASSV